MCAHPRASATRRSTSSAQPAAHLFGAWRGTCYSAWWMKFDSCTAARSAHNAPQSVHSRWPHASAQKIDTTSTAPASLLSRAPHVRAMAPFGAERSNSSKSIAERALESNQSSRVRVESERNGCNTRAEPAAPAGVGAGGGAGFAAAAVLALIGGTARRIVGRPQLRGRSQKEHHTIGS